MHGNSAQFLAQVSSFLGGYYLFLCAMNWTAALWMWRQGPRTYFKFGPLDVTNVLFWTFIGGLFLLLSPLAYIGLPFPLWAGLTEQWDAAKGVINVLSGPVFLTVGSLVLFAVMYQGRRFFAHPTTGWAMLNLSLLAMGMSATDPNFMSIVAKPDNVPIVGLVFLLGFFTWLATWRAVQNDDRIARGEPPLEKLDDEKVLVWPDLVYTELICMIALTAFLLVWGMALQAPLEEAASSVKTPNPSKAPWYFLGLQEMLVYFDPWMAGVVLPSTVILGLMAIPYLDYNKKGSGYYTIAERPFAYINFQFGFFQLWIVLIILGTFPRGPNWAFFGPFEYWDPHKVVSENNVNLSEFFWDWGLGTGQPRAPEGSGFWVGLAFIVYRESPGILLTVAYFAVLPPLLAATVFRKMYVKMGLFRYMLMVNLLLLEALLPIKMVLRWTVSLKYLIYIPEYFLNL